MRESDFVPSAERIRPDAKKDLPRGVELLDAMVTAERMRLVLVVQFSFDQLSKFAGVNLKLRPAKFEGADSEIPSVDPSSGFVVKDEGETVLIIGGASRIAIPSRKGAFRAQNQSWTAPLSTSAPFETMIIASA